MTDSSRSVRLPSSPARLLLLTAGAIFVAEFLVMLPIHHLHLGPVPQALLDAAGLLVILLPLLHGFVYKPLAQHIQARKESEERLLIEKHFVDALINSLPGIFFLFDRQGRLHRWNQTLPTLAGLDAARLQRLRPVDFFPEHGRETIERTFEQVFVTGQAEIETTVVAAGHRPIPYLFKALRVRLGDTDYAVGIGVDISQQKAAEKHLRESEAVFRSVAESATDGIISIDTASDIIYFNSSAARIFGYDRDEMSSLHLETLMPAESRARHNAAIARHAQAEGNEPLRKTYETAGVKKNGQLFPIEIALSNWRRQGKTFFTGIIRDVTERKIAEEQLAKASEEWLTTFDAIPDLITIIGTDHRILKANKAVATTFGLPRESLVGQHCYDVFDCQHTRQDCPHAEVLSRGTEVIHEVYLKSRRRHFILSSTPLIGRDGTMIGVVEVGRDITERRRMENALIRMRNLESIGVLAGGLAHDFNNLLTVILGNIQLARLMCGSEEKTVAVLDSANLAARKAQELSAELLTFSKGGSSFKIPVRLAVLAADAIKETCTGAPCTVTTRIPGDLWEVSADPSQLRQVLNNLFENAVEAMPGGGTITLVMENTECATPISIPAGDEEIRLPPARYVKILLTDEGRGIQPEHLPKIFDPYFSTKARGAEKGQGLGLSLCYSIVKNHGGYIVATSDGATGTTFAIYLPAL